MIAKRVLTTLERENFATNLALIWFALGAAWLVLAFMIGIGLVTTSAGRQVGFMLAFNWSLVYPILLPFILFFTIQFVGTAFLTLRDLHERRMLIDTESGRFIDEEHLDRLLNDLRASFETPIWIWLGLSALGLVFSWFGWWSDTMGPLLAYHSELELIDAGLEVDWATAAVFTDHVNPVLNALFSFLIYTLGQAVALAAGALFVIVTLKYSFFLIELKNGQGNVTVVASVRSTDERFGFEIFEDIGTELLQLALLLFAALYLTVLTNQYVNDQSSSSLSLIQVIKESLWPPDGWLELIDFDPSTASALVGAVFLLALVLAFLVLVPRTLANRGRVRLLQLASQPEFLERLEPAERARTEEVSAGMVTWPYRWLSLNRLFMIVVFAFGGIIFYRLFPYLFLVFLVAIVGAMVKELRSRGSGGGGGGSGG